MWHRTEAGPGRESSRRRWMLAVVALAPFLVVLEDHAMVIALPSLGRDLNLGLGGLEWVVNVYTLTAAILTLGGGMLADRYGVRPVLLAGLAVFTTASLGAALSTSGVEMIAMRAAQGVGAALMAPAALSVLLTSFAGHTRGVALGVWSGVAGIGTASGPLVGAVLTESFGWRTIFFLNVPVGAALLLAGRMTLPVSRPPRLAQRMDVAGLVLSAVVLSTLVFGLTHVDDDGWMSVTVWAPLVTAASAFALLAVVERRSPGPLLHPALFRAPNFMPAGFVGLLHVAVMCSLFFFLSLYLQLGTGSSAVQTGVALLPVTAVLAASAPVAGWLVTRFDARTLASTGLVLVAAGLLLLGSIDAGWGPAQLLPGLVVTGTGLGLSATPVTAAAMEHVPRAQAGVASAALNASGMLGMSLGIVSMGAVVTARLPADLTQYPADAQAFAAGIGSGLLVNAFLALTAAVIAVTAIRGRESQQSLVSSLVGAMRVSPTMENPSPSQVTAAARWLCLISCAAPWTAPHEHRDPGEEASVVPARTTRAPPDLPDREPLTDRDEPSGHDDQGLSLTAPAGTGVMIRSAR